MISLMNTFIQPPFDEGAIAKWLKMAPALTVDGRPGLADLIRDRLAGYWLPEEQIIYIGKTHRLLKSRLDQFYRHLLGRRSPHCGGSWIKCLSVLPFARVYWKCCQEPARDEQSLLQVFRDRVRQRCPQNYREPDWPLPFGNLCCDGHRKNHRFRNWTV